jgi:phage terminase small subunit
MVAGGDAIQVTESGYQQLSGWMTVRNNAQRQLLALWREFGMTPAARSKIEVKADEEEDEFAKLFGSSETMARKARQAG